MMDRRETKNQVLPASKVQEIIKRKIKAAMFDKNLSSNVELMTFLITSLDSGIHPIDPLDVRVEKTIKDWYDSQTEE